MWPFTAGTQSLWLVLYLLTFALHAVFVSYVLAGTGYALVQAIRGSDDVIAERVRDRLPFMLGCGITAGVAPLLFIQLLYQRRFYTANLLMGPRWGAVVPALIAGFYALYLAKAATSIRWRRAALAGGLTCFAFVAWSWTELHLLMQADPAWRAMYAAGERIYGNADVWPRLLLWLGAMLTLFATVAASWASGTDRRRLAALALIGRVVSSAAAGWLVARGAATDAAAHGWLYILAGALAAEAIGWLWTWRTPDGPGLTLATAAGTAALLSATVLREAPRLAWLEPPRPSALEASGFPVFALTLLLGIAAIVWIVRTIRT
jgi:hypothetical protein